MAAKVPAAGVDLDGAVTINDSGAAVDFKVEGDTEANLLFVDGSADDVIVGGSARLNTAIVTAANTVFSVQGPTTGLAAIEIAGGSNSAGGGIGAINWINQQNADGANFDADGNAVATIYVKSVTSDSNSGDDAGAEMLFYTKPEASGSVERMRITSTGQLSIGAGGPVGSSRLFFYASASTPYGLITQNTATSGSMYAAQFLQNDGSTELGSIKISNTGTAFNTSSDYRLKENVVTDWDATTRLKQLKPSRFNFISDADTTVDGFLAHEVSSIVPEAISGDKDATETKTKVVVNSSGFVIRQDVEEADWIAGKVADEDGNTEYPTDSTWEASKVMPAYQGIDQSKLVPLMVKTIQELEARIKTLEDA